MSNSLDPGQARPDMGPDFAIFFLSSADYFQYQPFSINYFGNTIRVSNSLVPDQARRFVGPDLDPNCLQMLPADVTSR